MWKLVSLDTATWTPYAYTMVDKQTCDTIATYLNLYADRLIYWTCEIVT